MLVPHRWILAAAFVLVPSVASAAPSPQHPASKHHARQARRTKTAVPRECAKAPVEFLGGAKPSTLVLAKCDGHAAPAAIERLSELTGARGPVKLDTRLVEQLEAAVEHFRSDSAPARVTLISGYRPKSTGSYHAKGRALDFKIQGVENEALVAFCKTFADTGCGYYPNSGFVHMDVREPGAGHVAWTDVSRPGEAPHYVNATVQSEPSAPPAADDAQPSPSGLPPLPAARRDVAKARTPSGRHGTRDELLHSI
ncbi:MAG TPA: DUF882 domain-containing protein [Polyangiaceae bacterium]|jgi:hypothetical protein